MNMMKTQNNKIKEIMRKMIIIILGICSFSNVKSQQYIGDVLLSIEQNNTLLSSLRKQAEADKTLNKTGIYLENPEMEYHYLWGNQNQIGNRTDFSAKQGFDFPTAYHYKKQISDGKNTQVDLKYQMERKNTLLEAKQICLRLIHLNMLSVELQKRLDYAQQVAVACQVKFEKGGLNILDNNKAKLNLLHASKELKMLETEQNQLQSELSRLNGAKEIIFSSTFFEPVLLSPDFNSWYEERIPSNPVLKYMVQETEINKKNEKLQRSLNLPKFSVGYMSEKVAEEQFQGIMVGLSIPLWENKNTVKQIKAQTIASQAAEDDFQTRQRIKYASLYEKARKLREMLEQYKETIKQVNSEDLLKKALDTGEISLIDYMLELQIYYETVDYILETERDYQLVMAELNEWEL